MRHKFIYCSRMQYRVFESFAHFFFVNDKDDYCKYTIQIIYTRAHSKIHPIIINK